MKDEDTKTSQTSPETTEKKPAQTEIEKLAAERDEYLAGWQRAKADFSNAKKRWEESLTEYRKMANEGLIEELLPVLSSFEMAFSNKDAWEKVDKNWRMGVEHIYNQLNGALVQNGLKEINPLGQKFDHNIHEAVKHEETDDAKKENTVVKVIEKGYMLGAKLIRPAKVIVAEPKGK